MTPVISQANQLITAFRRFLATSSATPMDIAADPMIGHGTGAETATPITT